MCISMVFSTKAFANNASEKVKQFVELAQETCLRSDLSVPAIQDFWKDQSGHIEIAKGNLGVDNLESLTAFYDINASEITEFTTPRNLTKQDYLNALHLSQHTYYSDIGTYKGEGYRLWMRHYNILENMFSECRLSATFTSREESLALLKEEFSPESEWNFDDDVEMLATLNDRFFSSSFKSIQKYPNVVFKIKIDCPSAPKELGFTLVVIPVGSSLSGTNLANAEALQPSLVRTCNF